MCIWFAYDDCMLHVCAHVTVCVCINAPSTFGCKNTCTYAHKCTYILHTCTFILHTCKNTCKIKLCTYCICICMYMHVSVCILCISSAVSVCIWNIMFIHVCTSFKFQVVQCLDSNVVLHVYWYVYLALALLCNRGATQQCNSSTTEVQQLCNRTWSVTAVQQQCNSSPEQCNSGTTAFLCAFSADKAAWRCPAHLPHLWSFDHFDHFWPF